MIVRILLILFEFGAILALGNDQAWGYYSSPATTLPTGSGTWLTPDKWSTRYPICGGTAFTGLRNSGNRQSPIDLSQVPVDLDLQPLHVRTYLTFTNITIEAIPQKQIKIVLSSDGDSYTRDMQTGIQYVLQYVNVHSPSEHTFGGSSRDLELQFIHVAADSEGLSPTDPNYYYAMSTTYLASEGSKSGFLDSLFAVAIPYLDEDKQNGAVAFNYTVSRTGAVADMPPVSRDYFRYFGSSTKPPCTENVLWNIYANPVYMSRSQLARIRKLINLPSLEDDAVFNISGATGSGNAMKFSSAMGNARTIADTPESLQPLLSEGKIYGEQKYATTVKGGRRLFTQTEIRNVVMYKEFVGDELFQHKVEKLDANEVSEPLAIASIVMACAGVGLAILGWMVARA